MNFSKKAVVGIIGLGFVFALLAFVSKGSFFDSRVGYLKNPIVLDGFTAISNNTVADVEIIEGPFAELVIEGDAELKERLIANVENGTLKLEMKKKMGVSWNNNKQLKIKVFAPLYTALHLNGSGSFMNKSALTAGSSLELKINGSGDIKLSVGTKENLTSTISGSGDISVEGTATNSNVKINGSGDFNGYNLLSQNTDASINGSGDVEVNAAAKLIAKINGSGSIHYKGDAAVQSSKRGSGDISKH